MKIEVGKYYKTRDGYRVGPMRNCLDCYDYEGSVGAFNGYGGSLYGCDQDLIAEWIDEPVTGTLHSLNAKKRDIVIDGNGVKYCLCQDDIDRWVRDDFRMLERYEDRVYQKHNIQSPVITETVTTQRIMPGVYGIVDLAGVDKDMVQIRLQSTAALKTWFAASEITAAIATLTQIRDALTHNSAK